MSFIAAQQDVQDALDQAERCVAASGAALIQGDPEQVHNATRELHDGAHALALVLRGVDGGAAMADGVRNRLMQVARDIGQQREALLRRSAVVDQSLQSLVPQTRQFTYAGALGRQAGRSISRTGFRTF